jgi:hypothetical protein
MTDQPSAQIATTATPVELTAADTAGARELLARWLVEIDSSANRRKEAFRSQVNGILDGLKLVEVQRFKHDTHVCRIDVTDRSHPVFFKYQVPVVAAADRRPEANAPTTLAGIVKDPAMADSVPKPAMLAIHAYVAAQATNRSAKLQADAPALIAYYEQFGYRVNVGEEKSDKPYMTATLDEMSRSEAARVQ